MRRDEARNARRSAEKSRTAVNKGRAAGDRRSVTSGDASCQHVWRRFDDDKKVEGTDD